MVVLQTYWEYHAESGRAQARDFEDDETPGLITAQCVSPILDSALGHLTIYSLFLLNGIWMLYLGSRDWFLVKEVYATGKLLLFT